MRKAITLLLASFIFSFFLFSQENNVAAIIKLADGETIEVFHFGQLTCSTNKYFDSFIMLKGTYLDSHTEMKDYRDINKLVFNGFDDEPVNSLGNEKGKIIAYKKNGISVELQEAELVMSCYGPVEKYNQIRVQMINPLTGKKFEKSVSVKDIESITFI